MCELRLHHMRVAEARLLREAGAKALDNLRHANIIILPLSVSASLLPVELLILCSNALSRLTSEV